jgi:hypothetical protein
VLARLALKSIIKRGVCAWSQRAAVRRLGTRHTTSIARGREEVQEGSREKQMHGRRGERLCTMSKMTTMSKMMMTRDV